MAFGRPSPALVVQATGESRGRCDCCRAESRSVSGVVQGAGGAVAAYLVRWTVGASLADHPSNFDLILEPWDNMSRDGGRVAVSAVQFVQDGATGVMVIDAQGSPLASDLPLDRLLARNDVVGTPLAARAYSVIDAIILQDGRLRDGYGAPDDPI